MEFEMLHYFFVGSFEKTQSLFANNPTLTEITIENFQKLRLKNQYETIQV